MYSVADASRKTQLSPGRISSLVFRKILQAEVHSPNGSGDYALLSDRNLKELLLIEQLQKLGVKLTIIKAIITKIAVSKLEWWESGGWLVGVDEDWFITDNPYDQHNVHSLVEAKVAFIVRI